MDDLHSSSQLFCSLFSPRYLEKEKRTKYCNYEIVTIKVPQHTSLLYSWFKYFFRDSHYGRGYVDCRPCYSLRGRLLDEESDTRGNTTGRGLSQASTLLLPLGIQVLQKKNQEPSTWKPESTEWSPEFKISGGSRRGARVTRPPLFLHQTEARRAEKKIFVRPGPPLFSGSGWPDPPPSYLKVWFRHWRLPITQRL